MNRFFTIAFGLMAFFTSLQASSQIPKGADAVTGIWLTGSGKGKIEIFKGNDGHYNGKIFWMRDPLNEDGKPKLDKNNPDPARKKAPLMGLQNLRGFRYEGDRVWADGKIYDPEKGSDYSCKMTLVNDNTLDVRGFIGISLFGRTDTWKRVVEKR
jgi:uncharacterized protein (DUF2147 family)